VLPFVFVAALLFHAGAITAIEVLRPEPLPRLIIKMKGKGQGLVASSPVGLSCTGNCSAEFEPGTVVTLHATTGEGSTFEGWSEGCTVREDWVLECSLTLTEHTTIEVGFGLVPERVDVAMIESEPEDSEKEITITLPDPEIEAELLTEPLEDILAELEPEPEPEPEPQPQPQPQAQAQAQPPPQQPPQMNLRSVEVPDENEVEEAPDDAAHLSDKNRDVAEETMAQETNLDREQKGEAVASEKSEVQSEEIGGEEAAIAQLEEAEATTLESVEEDIRENGRDDRVVGAITGVEGEDGEDGEDGDDRPAEKPGLLAMRGIEGRGSMVPDPKTGDGGRVGKSGQRGKWGIKTELDFEDYERIVGKDKVEKELALGRNKRKSQRRGRWEKKLGAVKSALENFTPEVKPGNQTALKTRAAPFAVYIARMHRRIHELWGFGYLDELDGKPADHPLNNWELYTVLEIVIDPDGSVVEDKLRIVHNSGRLEFDVAAIDTIMTASPYEPTPKKIRSPDGRVYIHWGFYRNHRQCGTFNAQPYILAEAPKGDADSLKDADLVRNTPRLRSNSPPPKSQLPERQSQAGSPASEMLSASDPKAVHAANLWLSAFAQGNINKMLKVTGTPFRSGTALTASQLSDVARIYQTVLSESRGRVLEMKVLTPAGYRKRFGAMPEGIDTSKGQLLAVVRMRKEQFALVLERQKDASYKVVGLHR